MNSKPFLDYLRQLNLDYGDIKHEYTGYTTSKTYTSTDNFRPWKIDMINLGNKKNRFPDVQIKQINNDGRIIKLLVKNNISDGELV
jgi:hypothetical protein